MWAESQWQQLSADPPLHTNHLFNLNCATLNGYKSQFLPLGPSSPKIPFDRRLCFVFFLLENCGPDLRQHAIVEAANTLYPGNRWGERKSTSWCHYEAMWPRCVSKQERRRGSAAGRRERLDPAQDCSSAHISAVMSTVTSYTHTKIFYFICHKLRLYQLGNWSLNSTNMWLRVQRF